MWIGVNTGGTFTDFTLYAGGGLTTYKVSSTPGGGGFGKPRKRKGSKGGI